MKTLRSQRKLAAMNKESRDVHLRSGTSRCTVEAGTKKKLIIQAHGKTERQEKNFSGVQ